MPLGIKGTLLGGFQVFFKRQPVKIDGREIPFELADLRVSIDGTALLLAEHSLEELKTMHSRCWSLATLRRQLGFGLYVSLNADLARVQALEKSQLFSVHYKGDETMPLPQFWKTWGLRVPEPVPTKLLEMWRGKQYFPLLRPDPTCPCPNLLALFRYLHFVGVSRSHAQLVCDHLCEPIDAPLVS